MALEIMDLEIIRRRVLEEEIKKLEKEIFYLKKKLFRERRRELLDEDYWLVSEKLDLELEVLHKEGQLSMARKELLNNLFNGNREDKIKTLSTAENELVSVKVPRVVPDTYPCGVLIKALEAGA